LYSRYTISPNTIRDFDTLPLKFVYAEKIGRETRCIKHFSREKGGNFLRYLDRCEDNTKMTHKEIG